MLTCSVPPASGRDIQQALPVPASGNILVGSLHTLLSACLRSTPLRSASLRSAPLHSAPLRSAPLSAPLRSTPLRSAPLRSAPLRPLHPLHSAPLRSSSAPLRSTAWTPECGSAIEKQCRKGQVTSTLFPSQPSTAKRPQKKRHLRVEGNCERVAGCRLGPHGCVRLRWHTRRRRASERESFVGWLVRCSSGAGRA